MVKINTTRIQDQIWYELDQARCAITKTSLCERINCSEYTFDQEKKALIKSGKLYVCQNGFILKEYADMDEKLWHLSWALGLLDTSATHVVLDKELLELAPSAIQTLLNSGEMDKDQGRRLKELRKKLLAAMEAPKLLLQIYHKVENLLDGHLESKRIGDGKTAIKDLKELKKYKKDFE
ncbi:MAG: hypothetical protein AUJ54_08865 [Ignavibacteria bacterium CG1_02_37_35]|nr:MAG: hypothetical protein AUJ54_08865 [Ignavibacteria bacterium CG1_02_37_35]